MDVTELSLGKPLVSAISGASHHATFGLDSTGNGDLAERAPSDSIRTCLEVAKKGKRADWDKASFESGTYILSDNGVYVLHEDIEMEPADRKSVV